jgi:hypothetical protein
VVGVALSRWTMSYFASALIALLIAEGLMAAGYGYPNAAIGAPETLVLVHVVAIGWLSLLMCGALFQFVPVLVAKPLHNNSAPLPTLGCLIGGLVALLLGFLKMAGQIDLDLAYFPIAAVLLATGFALVLWNLGVTLWSARPLPLPARFVVVGLVSVAATVCLGISFALVLGGVTDNAHFVQTASFGLPLHIIAGLGGWLTFTAVGVSYRLLAMFMLAPDLEGPTTRWALYSGTAALAVAIIGGMVAISIGGNLTIVLSVAGPLALCAIVLYGKDVLHLYHARKRRKIELNSRMASLALASLGMATALTIVLLAGGRFEQHIAAVVFLISFGWLSGLGLSKLYKIVAFLTWLECYGPIIGKAPTPRVQDLVVEPRATKWFALYFLAVWVATAALLLDASLAFRGAAALMAVATCGIIVQLVMSRSLSDVKPAQRLPDRVHTPHLLFSSAQKA